MPLVDWRATLARHMRLAHLSKAGLAKRRRRLDHLRVAKRNQRSASATKFKVRERRTRATWSAYTRNECAPSKHIPQPQSKERTCPINTGPSA